MYHQATMRYTYVSDKATTDVASNKLTKRMVWGPMQDKLLSALIKNNTMNPDLQRFKNKKEESKYPIE